VCADAPTPPTGNSTLQSFNNEGHPMLHYTVVFLVIALIAAVLGFGGVAASAAGIAKVLFMVFIVLALVSFVFGLLRR
jgi:uncharacterized membrane protein YtjA (UPF0391 family)